MFFNVQKSRCFKIVNLFGFYACKDSIKAAALPLTSGISSVLCGKYRNYAEDADLGNYVDPHRRILLDALVHGMH